MGNWFLAGKPSGSCMCIYVCVYMRRPAVNFRCHSLGAIHPFMRQTQLSRHQASRILLSLRPRHWDYRQKEHTQLFFCAFWGPTQVLVLGRISLTETDWELEVQAGISGPTLKMLGPHSLSWKQEKPNYVPVRLRALLTA